MCLCLLVNKHSKMPWVRVQQQCHHLSVFHRGIINIYRDIAFSCTKIARRVDSTVMNVKHLSQVWNEEDKWKRKRPTDQPRCITERQDKRFRLLFLQDRFVTTCEIRDQWPGKEKNHLLVCEPYIAVSSNWIFFIPSTICVSIESRFCLGM